MLVSAEMDQPRQCGVVAKEIDDYEVRDHIVGLHSDELRSKSLSALHLNRKMG